MNQPIVLIYHSKTGMTEKYAKWLCEELPCALVPYQDRNNTDLAAYDAVIYAGGFHAGKISGISWLKTKLPQLAGKTVFVLATGASPADSPGVQDALDGNFTPDERELLRAFYVQSGLCYEKMGPVDKLMMAVFRAMVKKAEGSDSETYQAICHSFDHSTKEALHPLIQFLKSQMKLAEHE